MSEHISWATCPHCGQPAAVGWVSTVAADGEPTGEIAVEFDCVATASSAPPRWRSPSAHPATRPGHTETPKTVQRRRPSTACRDTSKHRAYSDEPQRPAAGGRPLLWMSG
jgi:hypothetical protein